jgi:Pro-kumamolisin, activation domain/Bacterial Ig-like domain (group 3)/Subtilase family
MSPFREQDQATMKLSSVICLCVLSLFASCPCTLHAQAAAATNNVSRITAPIDESERVTLKGTVNPLARSSFDRGPAPASDPTGPVLLVLRRTAAQQETLMQYLSDLENPSSASYHKWLTPAQYGAQFGVAAPDLQTVESWLQSHGFRIEKVPASNNLIEFSGTLGEIQNAFHTSIHAFSVRGELRFANVTDVQIPSALAPVIASVGPLNNFRVQPNIEVSATGTWDATTRSIRPDLTLFGANNTPYLFVDPADAATVYDTPNSTLNPNYKSGTNYTGSGVTIGIVGVSDLYLPDIQNYRTGFLGESSISVNLPTVIVDGNDPGIVPGSAGLEALIDNEIAGGLAPGAKVDFYVSAGSDLSNGLFNAIARAVDDNAVDILSVSFGTCEANLGTSGNQLVLELTEQAAAQGISVTVSAGDGGSAGCDDFDTQTSAQLGLAVNGLASSPFSIAVGGTDFDVLPSSFSTYASSTTSGTAPYYLTAKGYIPEKPWNDSTSVNSSISQNVAYKNGTGETNIIAGGGGTSSVYSKPAFQASLTPVDSHRDLPDVSLFAGNGFYSAVWVVCSDTVINNGATTPVSDCANTSGQFSNSTTFTGIGGTSASAPAFAGILALAVQATGGRLGQADAVLYQLAQAHSSYFHDVMSGDNSVPCATGTANCGSNGFLSGYNAAAGYDFASGLGSVDAAAIVNNWTSVSLGSTSTTLQINGSSAAYSGVHGADLTFNAAVTTSGSAPTGTVAITDNANMTSGGTAAGPQNNGQIAIPLTNGSGSVNYNGLPGGSYAVTARYGGDTSFAASTSTPISVTISPEPSTASLTVSAYDQLTGNAISVSRIPYGSYVLADAAITGTAEGSKTQGVATGTVTFLNGTTVLGTGAVSSGNQASWPVLNSNLTPLPGGTYNLTAQYSGDGSFEPGTSQPVVFNIVPVATSFFMDQPSYSLASGQSTTVVFELDTKWNTGVGPTGTVSLVENNQVIASTSNFVLAKGSTGYSLFEYVTGTLSIQQSQFPAGLNTVTIAYSGDSNYAPSSTTITVESIASGGGLTITPPSNVTLSPGGTTVATVTLTPSGGYTSYINWGCPVAPAQDSVNCYVPETHIPLSEPVDTVVTVTGTSSATGGAYTATINGSDNTTDGVQLNSTFPITVIAGAAPALAVMNNGPLNVSAGVATGNTSNISIIPSGGLSGQVNLSCSVTTAISNPQSPPTCTVPSSITFNGTIPVIAQVQVNTSASTTDGAYAVVVTAISASTSSVTTTDSVPLTVSASPSFSLIGSGVSTVAQGSSTTATVTISPLNGFSGQVNLSCMLEPTFYASGTLGTCNIPSSVTISSGNPATVNVAIQNTSQDEPGLYLVSVIATDPNATDLGIDVSIDAIFAGQPTFTLSNGGNINVNAGATSGNSTTISLTPASGFTGAVNLSCHVSTNLTSYNDLPTCSVLSPVTISGTTVATATLTVNTTAPSTAALQLPLKRFLSRGGGAVLAIVLLFGIPTRRRTWRVLFSILATFLIAGTMGCGGGSAGGSGGSGGGNSKLGTTPGSYSVVVTGKDAATGTIASSTTVTLTVN